MKNISISLFALVAVGCTVSESKPLTDIDGDLWLKICEVATEDSVEETITCNGVDITIPAVTAAQCAEANTDLWVGDCTFGDWKACQEYEPADPCDPADLGPCADLFTNCLPAN